MRTDRASSTRRQPSYPEARLGECQQGPHSLLASAESQRYLQRQLTRSATWSELAGYRFHYEQFGAHLPTAPEPFALGKGVRSSAGKAMSRRRRERGASESAASSRPLKPPPSVCERLPRFAIGRTLARYPLAGPSPAPPFQTVRARFGHTAYRWSLGVRHAQGQDSVSFPTSDRVRAPKTSRTTSGRPLRADASARRGVERERARAVATRSGRSG